MVIHENRGLNPHIEDVTRRVALEGFFAIAPDALSPAGGTPKDRDEARAMIYKLDGPTSIKDFAAAVSYLKVRPDSTGKVGSVGFCWGGAMSNQLAVSSPGLAGAVSYYGRAPKSEDVPRIRASLLLHYAGLDKRVNATIPGYEEALKKAGVKYRKYIYEGANHAFNNDTRAVRYNKAAAELAWKRTIAFFRKTLEG